MSHDHVEIGRYIEELATLKEHLNDAAFTLERAQSLRRVLYGVYALVKLHFAKEEEVYLPILDQRLTPEAAKDIFEAMEDAARKAKDAVHVQ
jgi:hypothetical protein